MKSDDSIDEAAGLALLLKGIPGKQRQEVISKLAGTRAREIVDSYLDKALSRLVEDLPKLSYWQYIMDISLRSALSSIREEPEDSRRQTRKNKKVICPVEACGKPAGGPKWGWFCEEHKDLPEREKKVARTARDEARKKAKHAAKAGKKARRSTKRQR